MKPTEELWQRIAQRSVPSMARPKRAPWLIPAGVALVVAAAGFVFFLNGGTAPGTGPDQVTHSGETVTPNPNNGPISSASWAGMFIRMNDKFYWKTLEVVPEANLGDVLLEIQRSVSNEGDPLRSGDSNLLEAGAQVRAIQGSDPQDRVAAQIGDTWVVWVASDQPPH